MKVLVCEDDDIVTKVIQLALQEHPKVEATYVRDGRRAMDLLERTRDFELIITDIHMPFYNGDDILNHVRVEMKKQIPFVMISSDNEEEVVKLALKSGVSEFISKPVALEVLRKKLKKFLPT